MRSLWLWLRALTIRSSGQLASFAVCLPLNFAVGHRNPMSNQAPDSYLAAVHKALLSFQVIEEALKICVGLSYEVIAKEVPSPVVFRFDPAIINSAPLGKLIKMFSEINCNTELVGDLGKILKWRNFCAHNPFAHEFLDRAGASPFTAHDTEDVQAVVKFSADLVERLGNEMKSLRKLHRVVVGDQHE